MFHACLHTMVLGFIHIPMRQIQEQHGHSALSTAANISASLDASVLRIYIFG